MKVECPFCSGTGLYVGMAERDGAAIICHECNGTGCYEYKYEYTDFETRKIREGVKRVYLTGTGYMITTKDITLKDGTFIEFSKEGVSYEEFIEGKKPKHIESLCCPMSADPGACHGIDGFVDKCNELNDGWINLISSCKIQCNKSECWKRFNSQQN